MSIERSKQFPFPWFPKSENFKGLESGYCLLKALNTINFSFTSNWLLIWSSNFLKKLNFKVNFVNFKGNSNFYFLHKCSFRVIKWSRFYKHLHRFSVLICKEMCRVIESMSSKILMSRSPDLILFPFLRHYFSSRYLHPEGLPSDYTITFLFRILPDTPQEPFALWEILNEAYEPLVGVILDSMCFVAFYQRF